MANVMLEERQTTVAGDTRSPERTPPVVKPRALDLSILIVTWNSARWIDRCLRSIPAACEGLTWEVVVHDNASTDDTLAHLGSATVIRSAVNAGFAAGSNRAFADSQGRYVFMLNPDCELSAGALTTLVAFLDAHPNVAGAAPLLIDEEGGGSQREFQLRRLPTLAALSFEVLLGDKLLPSNRVTARHRYRDLDLSEPRHVEQPAGAALLLRRSVIEDVGSFDESFTPAWFEDVDYSRRLADKGHEIWVVPQAEARHFGGSSLEHIAFGRFADVWYRNMWRYAQKWFRPREVALLRWVIVGGMGIRLLATLVGFPPHGVGRIEAMRAYARVMGKALKRWSRDSSPSSS